MPVMLHGSFCVSCCDLFYPAQDACPRCGQPVDACDFCGKGDVFTYTVLNKPEAPADEQDIVALIHLAEGAYVTARLQGISPQTVFIGLPVEAVSNSGPLTFCLRRSLIE